MKVIRKYTEEEFKAAAASLNLGAEIDRYMSKWRADYAIRDSFKSEDLAIRLEEEALRNNPQLREIIARETANNPMKRDEGELEMANINPKLAAAIARYKEKWKISSETEHKSQELGIKSEKDLLREESNNIIKDVIDVESPTELIQDPKMCYEYN